MTAPDRDPLVEHRPMCDHCRPCQENGCNEHERHGVAALAPRPPETADAGALDAAWEALRDDLPTGFGGDADRRWSMMQAAIGKHRPLIEAAIRRDATPALDVERWTFDAHGFITGASLCTRCGQGIFAHECAAESPTPEPGE